MPDDGVPSLQMGEIEADPSILDAACREYGAFHLQAHGLDPELARDVLDAARCFFALPHAEKRTVARTDANAWGFYDRELTKNTQDWKEVFDFGPAAAADGPEAGSEARWPTAALPEFEATMQGWYTACEALAMRLLDVYSMGLGRGRGNLRYAFEPEHTSFIRLNHYPICPDPELPSGVATPRSGHLGVNHHTDAGAFTLLLQDDQPGMQFHHDDRWHTLDAHVGSLVVNSGDILQVWSNDHYPSVLHRVAANSERERFSVAFFMNPAYSAIYEPLPSMVSVDRPPRYRPIRWGEFRSKRAAGDYADVGEEVQIAHYAK